MNLFSLIKWALSSDHCFEHCFDLWKQLEKTAALKSDLRYTWTGARSGLLISMVEKHSLNTGAIDVNMDGFVLDKKSSFK